jgi:hypothetical protein
MVTRANLSEIREELRQARGSEVSDSTWEFLIRHGPLEKYLDAKERDGTYGPLNDLMSVADELEKLAGGRSSRQIARELIKDANLDKSEDLNVLKEEAQSLLIAREAAMDWRVRGFRAEVLGDKPVAVGDLHSWMMERAKEDGTSLSQWITIPVVPAEDGVITTRWPTGELARWNPDPACPELPFLGQWNPLRINAPPQDAEPGQQYYLEEWVYARVNACGVLGKLRDLSSQLVDPLTPTGYPFYPWTQAQAATFILTGQPPRLDSVEARIYRSPDLEGASRITLTIDPTVTPQELVKHYQGAREEVLPSRYHALTAKSLRLAAFVATRSPDETWEETRLAWHEWCRARGYPQEYQFPTAVKFSRAARNATNNLLRLKPASI